MNLKLFSFLSTITLFSAALFGQTDNNMLNTSTWTVGTGSVEGFTQYGLTSENVRLLGVNHIGDNIMLWRATPTSDGLASGGWNSSYINIAHTNSYRLSVWIKKTNSNNGTTFFGPYSHSGGSDHILNLNGTINNSPYFWNGDLPILDRWYLLVGYVYSSSYSSTISNGGIYDGITGEKIISITDFKFKNTASVISHRAYLWDDNNTLDRQYYHSPRLDYINGSEPSINRLLNINPNSKLLFAYDNAGNQKQRFYCAVANCIVPTPPAGRVAPEEVIASVEETKLEDGTSIIEKKLTLYPNPTKGLVSLKLNSNSDISLTNDVYVYNSSGVLVQTIASSSKNELEIDLTNLASGIYVVHIHLSNETSITRQIIKN